MSLKYHQVSKDPKSLKVKTISLAKDKTSPGRPSKFDSFDSSLKTPSSSSDLLSNIFSFNSSVGKAIQLCLQNQASLTQILLDLVHNSDEEKSVESFLPHNKPAHHNKERSKIFDDSYFQDTISFHLGSSKDKGGPSLAYRLESLINDITSVLKPPPPIQPLQPIKHEPNVHIPATTTAAVNVKDRQKENSPPKAVAPVKFKQEQKRTSVPHLMHGLKNNEFYFPKKQVHARKNSNIADDRRILTDSFLNKTALAPLDLTNQSRDERDLSKKYDNSLLIADTKTPKVTLKLTSPKNFIESRERSREKIKASPSPKNKNEHRFNNLAQYLKEIPSNRDTPKGSTVSKVLKGAHEKVPERMMERRGSERGPTMTSYFNPKPVMNQGEDNQEIIEETLVDNFIERQPESTALATLIDDTERVLQPAELNDSDTPMGMLNGASIGPLMEKRVIKAMLEDENDMMMRGSGLENLNEKKNLISAKWYRSWKEYVNFDCELENFGITQHIGTYTKPGRITNRPLLKYDVVDDLGSLTGDLELREHLLEHHDYEVVSRKVFSVLARWYGCDFEIARGMKEDPFKRNKFYLDLYPEGCEMRNNRGMKPREVSPNNGGYGQGGMMRTGKIINSIIQTNLINNANGHGQIKKKSGGRYDQC